MPTLICRARENRKQLVLASVAPLLVYFALPGALSGQATGLQPSEAILRGETAPEAVGVIDLPRLSGPITVDGIPDEPAWAALESLPLTMYNPTFRGSSMRRIELRIAYDDDAIYMAARFWHRDASAVRAFSFTRDRYGGDDSFSLMLDTFNDNENAVRFSALPLGARMDHSIEDDGQAPGPGNVSWNTFWDLETRITDDGWSGEIRVPFSSLRFETQPDGSVIMGLVGFAYESAGDTRWTFPAVRSSFPYQKVSAFQDVRLRGIVPKNPVYVSPYVLAGTARGKSLNQAGDAFLETSDGSREVGADLKFAPTPNLTVDLTLNTDFAAVEADQQQINLTRFSLFFDEKRPFFQERAGIFTFDTGADRGTLFYSRRVGLVEGRPVRILGGARAVGRVGGWDLGLISMQTGADDEIDVGSENFGVLRLRRRVLNTNSFVGAMATSRVGGAGDYNVTYGLDGFLRLFGNEYLTVKWLQTLQRGTVGSLDAGRVVLDWTRRSVRGFSYRNALVWSGPGYEPGVGFEPRRDFTRAQSDWNYSWLPGSSGGFRRIWLGATSNVWLRNVDDGVDTGEIQPFLQLETKPGVTFKVAAKTSYEDVPEAFLLSSDVVVFAAPYWTTEGSAELRAARGWPVRPNVTLARGDFYDGTRFSVKSDFEWPLSPYVTLAGGWEWNRIRFEDRGLALDANLLRLTVRGALDMHLSVDAFGQYNSLTDQLTTNTRLRYNFREGQDLWLVWNEGLNLERDVLGLPRLPLSDARTLTVKYTHTFIF